LKFCYEPVETVLTHYREVGKGQSGVLPFRQTRLAGTDVEMVTLVRGSDELRRAITYSLNLLRARMSL
jgi:hypothetical protein